MTNSMLTRCFSFFLLLILVFPAAAQTAAENEVMMADGLRQSGKIYVVVATVLVIVSGLLFYLFTLDRKLRRLENDVK